MITYMGPETHTVPLSQRQHFCVNVYTALQHLAAVVYQCVNLLISNLHAMLVVLAADAVLLVVRLL